MYQIIIRHGGQHLGQNNVVANCLVVALDSCGRLRTSEEQSYGMEGWMREMLSHSLFFYNNNCNMDVLLMRYFSDSENRIAIYWRLFSLTSSVVKALFL